MPSSIAFVCQTCGRRFDFASNLNYHTQKCIPRTASVSSSDSTSGLSLTNSVSPVLSNNSQARPRKVLVTEKMVPVSRAVSSTRAPAARDPSYAASPKGLQIGTTSSVRTSSPFINNLLILWAIHQVNVRATAQKPRKL